MPYLDNFEDKLNAVLNNPEAMDKVISMARSLSDSGGGQEALPEGRDEQNDAGKGSSPDLSGLLGGGGLDPALLGKLAKLMSAYNQGTDPQKMAVLNAVKPYLQPGRRESVDRALQTLRLAHVAREALGTDLLRSIFGGGKR